MALFPPIVGPPTSHKLGLAAMHSEYGLRDESPEIDVQVIASYEKYGTEALVLS
jgi:hypothetical protein